MRILLKNNGGYLSLSDINFPVEVSGVSNSRGCHLISSNELIRVGARAFYLHAQPESMWAFVIGDHSEEIKSED